MADTPKLADAYWKLLKRTDEARDALVAAILEDLDAGMTQSEVARRSRYTRERIRLIKLNRKG